MFAYFLLVYNLLYLCHFIYLNSLKSPYLIRKEKIKMGYCFVTTEKIKSLGTLTSKYIHNYRKVAVENADPNLQHLNEELLALPQDEYGNQKTYKDFFKDRIGELGYYKNHKIRCDQVYAFEVVSTFSREDDIDIEAWKKKNVEWLQKTFNQAGDGRNNIASVMFHADEPGNVHCHAIVIPIDPNGRLNAKHYTGGYKIMRDMQNSYANDMKEFGLERGLEGGQARHKDIKKYYAELNRAMEIPETMPFETAEEYRKRCQEELETLAAASKRKRDLEYAAHRERMAKERIVQRKAITGELESAKYALQKESEKVIKELEIASKKKMELDKWVERIERHTQTPVNEIIGKIESYDLIQKRMEFLKQEEPDKFQEIEKLLYDNMEIRNFSADILR